MNRIKQLFSKKKNIFSIFFTAGFPNTGNTVSIIENLTSAGVDLIEIGLPFSDPLADGPVIQHSSRIALEDGMSTEILFNQLENIRNVTNIPLVIMANTNPVMKYGFEKFCEKAKKSGIDGLIIPDLPFEYANEKYLPTARKHGIEMIFLVSPDTSEERIRKMDEASDSFLYAVSANSTTGKSGEFSEEQKNYFNRIKNLNLKNPFLIGFGISGINSFREACHYAHGAIIGSAFIRAMEEGREKEFIGKFKIGSEVLPGVES